MSQHIINDEHMMDCTWNTMDACFSPAAHFHFLKLSFFNRFSAGYCCHRQTKQSQQTAVAMNWDKVKQTTIIWSSPVIVRTFTVLCAHTGNDVMWRHDTTTAECVIITG